MRYNHSMIKDFKCKETGKIWRGIISTKLPRDIQQIARRKLRMINNAKSINDLKIPPNNRLEFLEGDRKGQCSIRINSQWRICFKWDNGIAWDVVSMKLFLKREVLLRILTCDYRER
jgi:proteic killer suppression protein